MNKQPITFKDFPSFPVADQGVRFGPKWTDSSWRNDACPSAQFGITEDTELQLYVNWPDPADREQSDMARYWLSLYNKGQTSDAMTMCTDTPAIAQAWIDAIDADASAFVGSGFVREKKRRAFIDRRVRQTKRELVGGMLKMTGWSLDEIPLFARSFSELHDYIDANELGGLCDDEINREGVELFGDNWMHACNEVQGDIDIWLGQREHLALIAAICHSMTKDQIECLVDDARQDEARDMLNDLQVRVGTSADSNFTPKNIALILTMVDRDE